jgi:hypothetical protein
MAAANNVNVIRFTMLLSSETAGYPPVGLGQPCIRAANTGFIARGVPSRKATEFNKIDFPCTAAASASVPRFHRIPCRFYIALRGKGVRAHSAIGNYLTRKPAARRRLRDVPHELAILGDHCLAICFDSFRHVRIHCVAGLNFFQSTGVSSCT